MTESSKKLIKIKENCVTTIDPENKTKSKKKGTTKTNQLIKKKCTFTIDPEFYVKGKKSKNEPIKKELEQKEKPIEKEIIEEPERKIITTKQPDNIFPEPEPISKPKPKKESKHSDTQLAPMLLTNKEMETQTDPILFMPDDKKVNPVIFVNKRPRKPRKITEAEAEAEQPKKHNISEDDLKNMVDFGEGVKKAKRLNKDFTVLQIKNVIEQYHDKYPKKKIPRYKTMKKKSLLELLDKLKIKIYGNYDVPENQPAKKYVRPSPLAKFGVKKYKDDEQDEYIVELNKNKRYENPLQALNKTMDKEGKKIYVKPKEHQRKFIQHYIFSGLKGCVLYHGTGSGKTLSAVIASYYYLKIYPTHKVIIISPSALLYNFIEGMVKYGLDIRDNRYSYFTYDQYIRHPQMGKNCLLIVDEAHNLRTPYNIKEIRDPETDQNKGEISVTNKRGYFIQQYGGNKAHKCLFLTATPFVNTLYDIENLLAMCDSRMPIPVSTFADVIDNANDYNAYFSYRISYFKSTYDENYPKRIDNLEALYMTDKEALEYDEIMSKGAHPDPDIEKENPNAFYSAEKYASNMINKGNNQKIEWIEKKIIKKSKQKFIVYSGLYDAGIQQLKNVLDENNIGYKEITGRQSASKKEDSKKFFNYYNFGKKNFFDPKKIGKDEKYINSEFRVLLISMAGGQGVDTINCQNIILLDGTWNDATSEQIIARAIRYQSHAQLPSKPKNERYVKVYRLFLVKKESKPLMDVITKKGFDKWADLKGEVKKSTEIELELRKKENKKYVPTVKELKELKIDEYSKSMFTKQYSKTGKKVPFIKDKTIPINHRGSIGKKAYTTYEYGWDQYNALKTDKERQAWRIKKYAEWYTAHKDKNEKTMKSKFLEKVLGNKSPITREMLVSMTIDVRLLILSKSKQENIDKFIKNFSNEDKKKNSIKTFEQYESDLMRQYEIECKKIKGNITDEKQAEIYAKLLKDEKIKILDNPYESQGMKVEIISKDVKYQQYFTSPTLAKKLVELSGLKDLEGTIKVLEPTAGDGALIKPVLEYIEKDIRIDMVELSDTEREKLAKIEAKGKTVLKLLDHQNFLTFVPPDRYDVILMNPPFHIYSKSNAELKGDVRDFDFVERAFAMLKKGGVLCAIMSKHFIGMEPEFEKWLKDKCKRSTYEIKKGEKFSNGVTIDIVLMKIEKIPREQDLSNKEKNKIMVLTDKDDARIYKKTFYKDQRKEGIEILNNEEDLPLKVNKENKEKELEPKNIKKIELKKVSRR